MRVLQKKGILSMKRSSMENEIHTSRLILRKLKETDADAVFLWGSDPVVNQYMIYPLYKNVEDVRTWLRSLDPDDPDNFDMGFVLKETGELIGSGGLVYHPKRDAWIVGYNLRADQWGRGYVVEAIEALLAHIEKTRPIHRMEATIAKDNPNSIRVAEKLGMTYVEDTSFDKLDGSKTFHAGLYRREFAQG